ncbi:MAG: transposase [Hahellaceae bacterium]|nr:transposase [Hahellaceae bacterium]MCP5168991.1 transposase [Hahellaceae bacterium]
MESVFVDISKNKIPNYFGLKGKAKVQGQSQLHCLVHNIERLENYG